MRTSCMSGAVALFGVVSAFAQTNTVVSGGYWAPAPIPVAPGQVITLFVDGIGRSLTQPVRASGGTWPTSLAGISVTLRQASDVTVPLFEVRPVSTCAGIPPAMQNACGTLAAVTVQIPFEIRPICPVCGRLDLPARLFVTDGGHPGALIDLLPLADQIHILTSCDLLLSQVTSRANTTGLPCPPIVTHADGSLVSASSPARTGEELVAYALGLGYTSPPATTGQPAAAASPTVAVFGIDYNFRPNALPTKPTPTISPRAPPVVSPLPVYSGLTKGFVGLYQINFIVPLAPAETPPCMDPARVLPGVDFVQSNFTVSFGSPFSFDGAGICVASTG